MRQPAKFALLLVLLCIVLASVIYYFWRNDSKLKNQIINNYGSPRAKQTQLRTMLATGTPSACEFTKPDSTIRLVINGEKSFTTTTTSESTSYSIFNGTAYYFWTEGESKGIRVYVDSLQESPQLTVFRQTTEATSAQKISGDFDSLVENGYSIKCAYQEINDNTFAPPSSLVF